MNTQVILKATQGKLNGEEFVFSGKMTCVVGRASDCSLRMPGSDLTVSRYHCLLDIDASVVWVEDLDSLNGTFLNGESIGRRDHGCLTFEISPTKPLPHQLVDGDELRIGDNTFEVFIDETPWAWIDRVSIQDERMAVA